MQNPEMLQAVAQFYGVTMEHKGLIMIVRQLVDLVYRASPLKLPHNERDSLDTAVQPTNLVAPSTKEDSIPRPPTPIPPHLDTLERPSTPLPPDDDSADDLFAPEPYPEYPESTRATFDVSNSGVVSETMPNEAIGMPPMPQTRSHVLVPLDPSSMGLARPAMPPLPSDHTPPSPCATSESYTPLSGPSSRDCRELAISGQRPVHVDVDEDEKSGTTTSLRKLLRQQAMAQLNFPSYPQVPLGVNHSPGALPSTLDVKVEALTLTDTRGPEIRWPPELRRAPLCPPPIVRFVNDAVFRGHVMRIAGARDDGRISTEALQHLAVASVDDMRHMLAVDLSTLTDPQRVQVQQLRRTIAALAYGLCRTAAEIHAIVQHSEEGREVVERVRRPRSMPQTESGSKRRRVVP